MHTVNRPTGHRKLYFKHVEILGYRRVPYVCAHQETVLRELGRVLANTGRGLVDTGKGPTNRWTDK